jgi:hypothetical protein
MHNLEGHLIGYSTWLNTKKRRRVQRVKKSLEGWEVEETGGGSLERGEKGWVQMGGVYWNHWTLLLAFAKNLVSSFAGTLLSSMHLQYVSHH